MHVNEYVLEADPNVVNEIRNELQDETNEDLKDYKIKKSSASFNLSEVKGVIYGGFSSRFWMLRKHLSMMEPD